VAGSAQVSSGLQVSPGGAGEKFGPILGQFEGFFLGFFGDFWGIWGQEPAQRHPRGRGRQCPGESRCP
ncbi:hypothetical protein HGM15179_019844, partial [Zosterops borbonicus]